MTDKSAYVVSARFGIGSLGLTLACESRRNAWSFERGSVHNANHELLLVGSVVKVDRSR
jgi:hypothetical protein